MENILTNNLLNEQYLISKECDDLGITRYYYLDTITRNILFKLHPNISDEKQYMIEKENGIITVLKEYIA
mgnify:CR=1 FL=1|tara:strand:- start:530 stop:739 length:210 start_codon:yes stop_codon:yes gene_type:complete